MKKVLLLLAEGFEIYEASVFVDVIGWNYLEGDKSTQLVSCALRKELRSSFGQKFVTDYLIEEIIVSDYDALAVPGGFEEYGFYEDAYHPDFTGVIQAFKEQDKLIASICTGALALGKAGILKAQNATTYNSPRRRSALLDFGARISDKNIVWEKNVLTSCNPATAVDVAFTLLELLTNKTNAERVKQLMGFGGS